MATSTPTPLSITPTSTASMPVSALSPRLSSSALAAAVHSLPNSDLVGMTMPQLSRSATLSSSDLARSARTTRLQQQAQQQQAPQQAAQSQSTRPPWRKVLYERQPYPDNYVDDSFLESVLKTSTDEDSRKYSLWSMMKNTAVITQHMCVLAMFFVVYTLVLQGEISVSELIGLNILVMAMCYCIMVYTRGRDHLPSFSSLLQHGLAFLSILLTASPILQTLTSSFCDDTIWALTIFFVTLCVVSHDYNVEADTIKVPGTLSLNAAVFSSVLLASRLPSVAHVFAFEMLALVMFAIVPASRQCIQLHSTQLHLGVTVGVYLITLWLLWQQGTLFVVVALVSAFFITIVAPFTFMGRIKYKQHMTGPWDIANVVQLS